MADKQGCGGFFGGCFDESIIFIFIILILFMLFLFLILKSVYNSLFI